MSHQWFSGNRDVLLGSTQYQLISEHKQIPSLWWWHHLQGWNKDLSNLIKQSKVCQNLSNMTVHLMARGYSETHTHIWANWFTSHSYALLSPLSILPATVCECPQRVGIPFIWNPIPQGSPSSTKACPFLDRCIVLYRMLYGESASVAHKML